MVLTEVTPVGEVVNSDRRWCRRWLLNGCGRRLRDGLVHTLGVEPATVTRTDLVHQLGPWWEVLYGLDEDRPVFVASGLEGIRSRFHR